MEGNKWTAVEMRRYKLVGLLGLMAIIVCIILVIVVVTGDPAEVTQDPTTPIGTDANAGDL